jgi:hypothetical protein
MINKAHRRSNVEHQGRVYDDRIASFEFADRDRQNPAHNLACAYVARPDVALRLANAAFAAAYGPQEPIETVSTFREEPIHRQEAGSVRVIGFIYVVIVTKRGPVAVEVRAEPCPLSDVLRSVASRRRMSTYYGPAPWALATPYPIHRDDQEALLDVDIDWVFLGDPFARWLAERRSSTGPHLASMPLLEL